MIIDESSFFQNHSSTFLSMFFYPEQVDYSSLDALLLTLNLDKEMNFLTNEEIEDLSNLKTLIEEIYESKCLHTNKEDILNYLYELQYEGLGLLIHQYWNEDDATFGAKIRERFRKDFLKVSYIEAFEKIDSKNYLNPTP